jgi:3'-phosphoadenosine 5'-phosphosulfate sulfotransferase (PAPS reductase)/FAD synthetase
MDIDSYDKIIVYFSGGKDSLACLLNLFDLGVDPSKIELWHHEIDGREGSELMDWPITPDYCRKIAAAFGVPIYFSWKIGGFEREMLRHNALTAPTRFETPDEGIKQVGGTRGKANTRLKFPQVSANLSVRWCSAYLKIDVGAAAIRNQKRFNNSRTLTISGERAEESAARANYKEFEPDRSDNRNGRTARHVDRWRPVHAWTEAEIWAIIKKYSVNPHPAYWLGWGRVSCQF